MFLADRLALDAPRRTADGYLAVRARTARTGVYEYRASEVDAPADRFGAGDTVKVYRDADEVFASAAVRSFIGRPITEDHPREAVTAANWREHARGMVMGALRDGEYLAFDLVLMDAAAIAAIEGGKRALSNGYQCQLDWTAGTAPDGTSYDARQTAIRGNHVALVEHGRAGSECAIPGSEFGTGKDSVALCDANPAAIAAIIQENNVPKTITLDGLPVNLGDEAAVAAAIARLQGQIASLTTARDAAETQVATLTAERATLDARAATLEMQLADARLTPQQLRDAARAYQAVADKAKALGVTVSDEMDEAALMTAAVTARLGDAAKDWNEAQIAASFTSLAAGVADKGIVNIGAPRVLADQAAQLAIDARAQMIAEMNPGSKSGAAFPGSPAFAGAGKSGAGAGAGLAERNAA